MSDHPSTFFRFYHAHELPTKTSRRISTEATDAECAALAESLDLKEIRQLTVKAEIAPAAAGEGVWRVSGEVTASIDQACVVTLGPVKARLEEPFDRMFSRFAEEDTAIDIDIEYDQDDPPEPLGDGVDIGALAIEALVLGLNPYPRTRGAEFQAISTAPPGVEPLTPEATKPFAGLASLKKAMESPTET